MSGTRGGAKVLFIEDSSFQELGIEYIVLPTIVSQTKCLLSVYYGAHFAVKGK